MGLETNLQYIFTRKSTTNSNQHRKKLKDHNSYNSEKIKGFKILAPFALKFVVHRKMVSPKNIINITNLTHSSNKPIKTDIIPAQTASQAAIQLLLPQALLILFRKLLISPQTGQNQHILAAQALKAFFGTLNTIFGVKIEARRLLL
ncbi:hypothetical protein PPERSA_11429 [Pseudocohnilembus persalinus]|uniref:Uncharacterized protein n=1 Tax=Pseudocohnilembus persalinus TaxID=266149 RepID=A0A0V0QXM2_PSEPJ|nr:hypothetical protein PPERSA_11429 [Pseudocohnilembus persalinus]|eukprot:KRX06784.1 hypothetical protein PPERSA_11429 [Pseudocohnilembus persalinus]